MTKNLPESPKNDKSTRVSGELVNPSNKSELMRERNIQEEADDSDDFIDLTEII